MSPLSPSPLESLLDDLAAADDATAQGALDRLAHPDAKAGARLLDESSTLRCALLERLGHPHRTWQRRAAAALEVLAPHSAALRADLHRALCSPRQRLRWGTAWVLGQLADPPSTLWPALREAMALEDGDQRWAAARLASTLARLHPEVAAALHECARTAPPTLRKMALYCLRDLAPGSALATARAALEDPDPGVRLAALALLARTARREEEDVFIERLEHDPDPGVRRAAAATLARLGPPSERARAALAAAARSNDPSLCRAARRTLGEIP